VPNSALGLLEELTAARTIDYGHKYENALASYENVLAQIKTNNTSHWSETAGKTIDIGE
jgi:hypothetical protein